MAKTLIFFAIVLIIFQFAHGAKIKIGITHWNDVSGQLESFDELTSTGTGAPTPCAPDDNSKAKCVGGLVQMVHWIHDQKFYSEHKDLNKKNIFRINAGNFIGGESGWLPCFEKGWEEYAKLLTTLFKPDVSALGMKEFGAGVNRTNAFLDALNASTVTVANTCTENHEEHKEEKSFCTKMSHKLVTLNVVNVTSVTPEADEELQIGIVGFTNPTVERLSLPGQLMFSPIVESIQEKIKESNIKTFIAIGDGPLSTVKEILDKIPEVKMVIYSSGFKAVNISEEYPVKHEVEGKPPKWYATAGRFGSSVGKLVLDWDTDSGELSIEKNMGKLEKTSNVTDEDSEDLGDEAKQALDEFKKLEVSVTEAKKNEAGKTRVTLTGGEVCWRGECNLGNLMTDAMVHCVYKSLEDIPDYPIHSIWHGGAFFDDVIPAKQSISEFDIHKWLPYHNRAHLVKVSGEDLWRVFQASAGGIDPVKNDVQDWRQFLQVSNGIKIVYENKKTVNVTQIKMIIDDSDGTPKFEDVPSTKGSSFVLVIPTYLFEGRGVYGFAKNIWEHDEDLKSFAFDDECLDQYIRALGVISVGIEERIWIVEESNEPTTTESATTPPTTVSPTTEEVTTESTENPTTPTVTTEPTTPEITTQPPTTPEETTPIVTHQPPNPPPEPTPAPKKRRNTAVTVILIIVYTAMAIGIIYIGYFKVLPKLRNVGVTEAVNHRYPQNQL